jgi:hypothetical protein
MRRAVARPADADDLMTLAVDFEEAAEFSERQKAAFRMHDAFLDHPAGFGAAGRAEILDHYSAAQVVELALKFFWWSTNRATVSIGGDRPHDPDRVTSFHYDEDGRYAPHAPRR